jgi:hypothetical protein
MSVGGVPPLAFSHLGLTIPDIFGAIDWYGEVFGATHIMGPRCSNSTAAARARHPGVGLELFQFWSLRRISKPTMPYWNAGPLPVYMPGIFTLDRP